MPLKLFLLSCQNLKVFRQNISYAEVQILLLLNLNLNLLGLIPKNAEPDQGPEPYASVLMFKMFSTFRLSSSDSDSDSEVQFFRN